jgi:XTP/dITP diphosphohydrolase
MAPALEVIGLNDTPAAGTDVDETGTTFEANALLKAEGFGRAAGGDFITLADDSGLVVDPLDGRPGVRSARYAETNEGRIARVVDECKVSGKPTEEWTARFVCVVALWFPETLSHEPIFARGEVEGRIVNEMRGDGGFGYDPIFYLPERDQTMAELSVDEKNEISHRGRALQALVKSLREKSLID